MKTPEIYLEPKPRTTKIIELLEKQYPNAKTALNYTNPLEILVATMLSAQTTDVQVNIVTQTLFKKYHTPEDYANADLKELEQDIRSTGFYHNKARNLKEMLPTPRRKIPLASPQNNGGTAGASRCGKENRQHCPLQRLRHHRWHRRGHSCPQAFRTAWINRAERPRQNRTRPNADSPPKRNGWNSPTC